MQDNPTKNTTAKGEWRMHHYQAGETNKGHWYLSKFKLKADRFDLKQMKMQTWKLESNAMDMDIGLLYSEVHV